MKSQRQCRLRLFARATLALAAAALSLIGPRAFAEPTCGVGRSAANCFVDGDGCEITQGVGLGNTCNSNVRTDNNFLFLSPSRRPDLGNNDSGGGEFVVGFFGANAAATAFASLYCTTSSTTAIYKGSIRSGDVKGCPRGGWPQSFPFRAACGPFQACQSK